MRGGASYSKDEAISNPQASASEGHSGPMQMQKYWPSDGAA